MLVHTRARRSQKGLVAYTNDKLTCIHKLTCNCCYTMFVPKQPSINHSNHVISYTTYVCHRNVYNTHITMVYIKNASATRFIVENHFKHSFSSLYYYEGVKVKMFTWPYVVTNTKQQPRLYLTLFVLHHN